jgi:hypothetical protein
MMTIMNLFDYLMKLFLHDNHGDLQPHVIIYLEPVHLHQLQDLLVFKTNNQVPMLIWYLLIQRWNESNYSTSWSNFIISTKDLPIN